MNWPTVARDAQAVSHAPTTYRGLTNFPPNSAERCHPPSPATVPHVVAVFASHTPSSYSSALAALAAMNVAGEWQRELDSPAILMSPAIAVYPTGPPSCLFCLAFVSAILASRIGYAYLPLSGPLSI
jgi:hypothetical protein